ncbi:MAG TPA: paraquat-inducible protein A, partial [Segetibacter sp.]
KKFVVKKFVDVDKIKAQVPGFAKTMMAQVKNRVDKKQLTATALSKYAAIERTPYFDSSIRAYDSLTSSVYNKYKVSTDKQLNDKLNSSLSRIQTSTYNYSSWMLGCIIIVLVLWWILRKRTELHAILFVMSLLFAFILLAVGLSASMIEVDARIPSIDFTLLGEHIVFKDQVLFFQSKSILDVVHVLINQPDLQSKSVGILILVFSILFPVIKLTSTGIHLLAGKKIAENKIVKYFAFQSGKWSMADVFVIAILMAYIGLNGLLQNQLEDLNVKSDFLTIIATNNTALQPGYIIFISYVLYGLVLSTILKSITPHRAVKNH